MYANVPYQWRAKFELWVLSNRGDIARTEGGEYRSAPTECAWVAWIASESQLTSRAAIRKNEPMTECTCDAKDMPFGRCCKAPTSASVIAGLQMALSQAEAMIERQQHVMRRAMAAWDSTTHQKNGDGRLWQCMEELRAECREVR